MTINRAVTLQGRRTRRLVGLAMLTLLLPAASWAAIRGEERTGSPAAFNLTAKAARIVTPDGASIYSWGFAGDSGVMQVPAPTLIVDQNAEVTVTLTNALPTAAGNVSIVFPGQEVTTTDGVAGPLTAEALPGGTVTYHFTASRPGTFVYQSGTRPDLQVEMGLAGAIIVRPDPLTVTCPGTQVAAYGHPGTCYDREYLFLLSEIDINVHRAVEAQIAGAGPVSVAIEPYTPQYWLINGRAAPDTMAKSSLVGTGILAHQPYGALAHMHPGERVLMRVVGVGHQMHPFHHHGNHAQMIARDAHLLVNDTLLGGDNHQALVGQRVFTITSIPGGTADGIWQWTGERLGWDIYGHTPGDGSSCTDTSPADGYDDVTHEWCDDHNRPIPVDLPALQNMSFGGFWSGSPFLGVLGSLPPGEGGLNPSAGFSFMWHSHTERELVNNDVFPGGMMTMLIVEPPGEPITE